MALGVMARFWPLRPRTLHADFCAGERVIERKVKPNNRLQKKPAPVIAFLSTFYRQLEIPSTPKNKSSPQRPPPNANQNPTSKRHCRKKQTNKHNPWRVTRIRPKIRKRQRDSGNDNRNEPKKPLKPVNVTANELRIAH